MAQHWPNPWWRHQIETFSALLDHCEVDSPHKGQCRGALMFSWICRWTNDWANNRDAGVWRRHRAHYDVIVMIHYFLRYIRFGPTFVGGWFYLFTNVLSSLVRCLCTAQLLLSFHLSVADIKRVGPEPLFIQLLNSLGGWPVLNPNWSEVRMDLMRPMIDMMELSSFRCGQTLLALHRVSLW